MRTLSIIIPLRGMAGAGYTDRRLQQFQGLEGVEVILVGPDELLGNRPSFVKAVRVSSGNRAQQFNAGALAAQGEVLLLHHSRSVLRSQDVQLLQRMPQVHWGGYSHRFDAQGWQYSFTSWYSNVVRADLRSIFYFDHCLFVRRDLFRTVGGVPEIDIFEDHALCKKLRAHYQGQRLKAYCQTSARRFQENGFVKQSAVNQLVKVGFLLGLSDKKLNAVYEHCGFREKVGPPLV